MAVAISYKAITGTRVVTKVSAGTGTEGQDRTPEGRFWGRSDITIKCDLRHVFPPRRILLQQFMLLVAGCFPSSLGGYPNTRPNALYQDRPHTIIPLGYM